MKCFSCEHKSCHFANKLCYMGCSNYKEEITKEKAEEFYRDLCGTVYGDPNKNSGGVMSVGLIADHMCISIEKANLFCDAMIKFGITERQNGMVVV